MSNRTSLSDLRTTVQTPVAGVEEGWRQGRTRVVVHNWRDVQLDDNGNVVLDENGNAVETGPTDFTGWTFSCSTEAFLTTIDEELAVGQMRQIETDIEDWVKINSYTSIDIPVNVDTDPTIGRFSYTIPSNIFVEEIVPAATENVPTVILTIKYTKTNGESDYFFHVLYLRYGGKQA